MMFLVGLVSFLCELEDADAAPDIDQPGVYPEGAEAGSFQGTLKARGFVRR